MADNVADFTDASFDSDVVGADVPVLVDFWAPWCGPCRMLAPTIEQIAADYDGKVRVGKLNTDENPNIASTYQIASIPTVMLFKNGEAVDRSVGMAPKEKLAAMLDKHLA
ncbi:MAG: thioredoxin [Planctomycetota bacterium]